MPENPPTPDQLAMFLTASPFFVDLEQAENKESISERFDSLPQNIQNVLIAEDTAAKIWNLAVLQHGLSVDQVRAIARTIRDILIGKESAVALRALLEQRVGEDESRTNDIVRVLTQQIISPNYFQIAQLYERKQRQRDAAAAGTDTRPSSPGPRDDRIAPASRGEPPKSPLVPPRPRNLVDLRGGMPLGSAPRRGGLPPSPPPVSDPQS